MILALTYALYMYPVLLRAHTEERRYCAWLERSLNLSVILVESQPLLADKQVLIEVRDSVLLPHRRRRQRF